MNTLRPSDWIDRNAHCLIGAFILFVFFLAGCDFAHVHAMFTHDSHGTYLYLGSPVRAIVFGFRATHGWILDPNAALD